MPLHLAVGRAGRGFWTHAEIGSQGQRLTSAIVVAHGGGFLV